MDAGDRGIALIVELPAIGLGSRDLGFQVRLLFTWLGYLESVLTTYDTTMKSPCLATSDTWVVVKIMVPFWVPIIIRHLIFRVPKKGP